MNELPSTLQPGQHRVHSSACAAWSRRTRKSSSIALMPRPGAGCSISRRQISFRRPCGMFHSHHRCGRVSMRLANTSRPRGGDRFSDGPHSTDQNQGRAAPSRRCASDAPPQDSRKLRDIEQGLARGSPSLSRSRLTRARPSSRRRRDSRCRPATMWVPSLRSATRIAAPARRMIRYVQPVASVRPVRRALAQSGVRPMKLGSPDEG